jgi:rod shape-determining protein MreD
MNQALRYILSYFGLLLFQVLILKSFDLGVANWWVTPFVYVIFIINLPVRLNEALILLLAALMGLIVDIFYNTLGFHMSAAVLVAFIRKFTINLFAPREGYEPTASPIIPTIGFYKYIVYSGLLLLIYHFWFFLIESFSFQNIFLRLLQALVSSFLAVMLSILYFYLFNKPKR